MTEPHLAPGVHAIAGSDFLAPGDVKTKSAPRLAYSGERILYDRKTAAIQLSISVRALDYLIAGKKISTRRIGKKVLIPRAELLRFSRADHYDSVAETERAA